MCTTYGISNEIDYHIHISLHSLRSYNLSLGCPSPVYYGETCSLSCSPHCINSRCHIETGHCFGCKDGYHGPMCEQRTLIRFIQSIQNRRYRNNDTLSNLCHFKHLEAT